MKFLTTLIILSISLTLAGSAIAQDSRPVALNRLLTASEIVDREPQGESAEFSSDGNRVYVFVDVYNPDTEGGELTMTWTHEGGSSHSQTVEYGQSRRWRTWAARRMNERQEGEWTVTVTNSQGEVLGEVSFEVVPSIPAGGMAALEEEFGC
ncbi:MAG: DUF2914 domain-containing protein [Myxococcales bacterium]|nr:DUF2914 domain-containing protein [Myxococcales bacterium]